MQAQILGEYLKQYDPNDDQIAWFEKIKKIGKDFGYTSDRKEYDSNPSKYKGMIGDVAMVIRVAITHRTKSPDLYQVMQVMGIDMIKCRIENYIQVVI